MRSLFFMLGLVFLELLSKNWQVTTTFFQETLGMALLMVFFMFLDFMEVMKEKIICQ